MRLLLQIVTALSLGTWALAVPPPSVSGDTWMEHYYEHPSPERFREEVRKLQKSGLLHDPAAIPRLTGFFARLFAANEDKLPGWLSLIDEFPDPDRGTLFIALCWADTESARKTLQRYASGTTTFAKYCSDLLAMQTTDFKRVNNLGPGDIDACWGSFFATGDRDYVLPVIRLAATPRQAAAVDISPDLARSSLHRLCSAHPAIAKIKDEFYRSASEQERKSLDELFHKEAEPPSSTSKERFFWRAGGKLITNREDMKMEKNFGVWLDLTDDEKFFQDWLKPTERFQRPKLKTTKRPLKVYTLVLFGGAGADENGRCDVTYDIALKDPNGKIFGQHKNMDGWKDMPPPAPREVQLGKSYLPLEIGRNRPPGRYRLEATVRDRIKNVELSLVHHFDVE